ncbi:MAG: hypothetical protein VX699_11980 [Myxococcota bacterium]|nr:hypothetical protein [Myxococcota bacterium]
MPCSDISETIQIRLDVDERLRSYQLNKASCGAEVGSEGLLLELVEGRTIEQILGVDPGELPGHLASVDDALEFLAFKHLFALQSTLEMYTGQRSGDPTAACSVASILHDFAGVEIQGVLASAPLEEKIRACGHCGSCGRVD